MVAIDVHRQHRLMYAELPNVTGINPSVGPTAGKVGQTLQVVTVTGNNFVPLQVNSITPTLAFTCLFGSMCL